MSSFRNFQHYVYKRYHDFSKQSSRDRGMDEWLYPKFFMLMELIIIAPNDLLVEFVSNKRGTKSNIMAKYNS